MATKQTAFTTLATEATFTRVNHGGEKCIKVSATLARSLDIEGSASFRMRGSEMVQIEVPDPTAEEIAASRLRRCTLKLEDMIETGQYAQRELAQAMAKEHGWFGVFSNYSIIERQMKAAALLHVGTAAKSTLEHPEGGIEVLLRTATGRAMQYARSGYHSTSAVSNVAEEMQAAAWAEVAEACGQGH